MRENDSAAGDSAGAWLTGRQSERASGHNIHSIQKYALLGKIKYRAEPGEALRFWGPDLSRLADGR